ncbi:uncharacterized protein LOC112269211 isoform X1 [Brachypodium distachyon]|uniref:Reverse transcriptase zinc-binding domain-containing protein n=1 Tax=Brachypodium distachyon TaxID=15368 RepID=A0A2K2CHS5_BRADI|nr:uncharacterized protein LOC112269211 isoform X1 [Brachypodium distachyon]PNT61579.1 hypothetical protein BRADI_5g17129v3 [Brachypodium distachyon]|eukprot:XP_024311181.1 uncharacterized protein LOC112269211 isoform X1 [Brachypodium distachyon]
MEFLPVDLEIFVIVDPNARTASKTWRAILAGRSALEKRLISRIGDGSSVSVWNDRWILGSISMKPMGRLCENDVQMVSDLIIPGAFQRDVLKIRDTFFAPDADLILQIPLRRRAGEDWIVWQREKSGLYSVMSTYRNLVAERDRQEDARGGGPSVSDLGAQEQYVEATVVSGCITTSTCFLVASFAWYYT